MPQAEVLSRNAVFAKLVTAVQRQIAGGLLREGDRLPSEAELSERFAISVSSVRRGIDLLVQDGLVVRRQGSGTYVLATSAAPAVPVVRDQVALAMPFAIRGYHPYFTERLRGLRQSLTARGWHLWDFGYDHAPIGSLDNSPLLIDAQELAERLLCQPALAGAVLGASTAELVRDRLGPRIPLVAANTTRVCPFVDYDWAREQQRALACLVAAGARRLWCYSGEPPVLPPGSDGVVVHYCPGPRGLKLLSEVVSRAYAAACEALGGDAAYDGVLAGSDFELQGILDAISRLGLAAPGRLHLAALVSRESRLHGELPMYALVADGHYHGQELARLLHQRITAPETAPTEVWLSCTLEHRLPAAP
jgi:DNA-binding transcriptional regulator YhcF (GntR family)/DNA-binding LacI/PurR family transcriptional regulator